MHRHDHRPTPRNLSIQEACEAIGVSRRTVYKLTASGRLATVKIGRRRLVPPSEITRMTSAEVS